MQVELIIIGIVALAGGLLSGIVANAKNRDVFGWVVAGALFPLLGLIAIAGMPVAQQKISEKDYLDTPDGQQQMLGGQDVADNSFGIVTTMGVLGVFLVVLLVISLLM